MPICGIKDDVPAGQKTCLTNTNNQQPFCGRHWDRLTKTQKAAYKKAYETHIRTVKESKANLQKAYMKIWGALQERKTEL